MNEKPDFKLREKTDAELCDWIGGWNEREGGGKRLLGMHELQRRARQPDAVRSWIAIGISITAVALSVILRFIK